MLHSTLFHLHYSFQECNHNSFYNELLFKRLIVKAASVNTMNQGYTHLTLEIIYNFSRKINF